MHAWLEILRNNDFIGAKKYIKDGADLNDETEAGESVLATALRYHCDDDLIELLIQNDADVFNFDDEGVSIFDMAITYDNVELVKYLLDKDIDVNQTQRRSRFTPLMCAACYGRAEIAQLLLDNGAKKDATDSKGFNATDFARKMNKKSVLIVLDFDETLPQNRAYIR